METIEELIAKINQNTAAQKEQTERWRLELGLPDMEPTKLVLLLQKWEQAREAPLAAALEGVELPSREPKGVELSQEPPAAVKGEEMSNTPPSRPQQQPGVVTPALSSAVPCSSYVDISPECPDLPPLDLMPRSQHCQAQLGARSPAPLLPEPETSRCGRQTSRALPLPSNLFPSRSQTSLRRSRATHFCLSQLAPGHRPVFRSPLASHLGPSSPDRGPFLWAPDFKGGGNYPLHLVIIVNQSQVQGI
ncbi:UNVERIFIED_CONTAM: hypothetical protein FKN15_064846 [Acipenser sinensis]